MPKNKIKLFNVLLPQTTKQGLREKLASLTQNSKTTLYFYYSEFLLRANRNPFYKDVLQKADLSAIDGRGLHWSQYKLAKGAILPKVFKDKILDKPTPIRIGYFILTFPIQLILNIFSLIYNNFKKTDFAELTDNELVLGRSFSYDILTIAQNNGWKTLIMGAGKESDEVTEKIAKQLFPKLNLKLWTRNPNSLLMQDKFEKPEIHRNTSKGILAKMLDVFTKKEDLLTQENLFVKFPDLMDAVQFIKNEKPDLILVGIGGGSGKQEFFIDYLKKNPEIKFTLATGLGAAFDHLGTGVKEQQSKIPVWMTNMGLEWLWRLWKLSYRRGRIIDAVVTLWFWTTVSQFAEGLNQERKTVINILKNTENKYLLVKRRNLLPGNVAWSFVQGGVEKAEDIEESGLREIVEEVDLEPELLQTDKPCLRGVKEYHSISFFGFVLMQCKYDCQQHYINYVTYLGTKVPTANWENFDSEWFTKDDVMQKLSLEKRPDWLLSGENYK